jgi:membrane protease YdiL (CAAX protease family)
MLTAKAWRPEAVILFCGLQLICLCLGAMVIGLLDKHGVAAFKLPDGFGAVVIGTLSFQGAALGLMALFLWYHQFDWREFFGLRDPCLARNLGRAVIVVLVLLPILAGMQWLVTEILDHLGWKTEDELAVQVVLQTKSLLGKVYMAGFAVVLAPVAEEFIFRGMLFSFIKQLGFPRTAWIGVSILFALIHGSATAFLPLFVLALTLTWLYEKSGHLLAPIVAHALFNAVNLVWIFGFNQSSS